MDGDHFFRNVNVPQIAVDGFLFFVELQYSGKNGHKLVVNPDITSSVYFMLYLFVYLSFSNNLP